MNNALDAVRIMSLAGAEKLGEAVLSHLKAKGAGTPEAVSHEYERFPNGDGKIAQRTTCVRDKIVFLFVDPYNYGVTYTFRGKERETSPDEHACNVHRAISAMNGKEQQLYIVEPLLYQARQDRRDGKNESLDMAIQLNNVKDRARKLQGFATVDVHNQSAFESALSDYNCINLYPTSALLSALLQDIGNQVLNVLIAAPDQGAEKRASIFANMLDVPYNNFQKKRNKSKGSTLEEHIYKGDPAEVAGKDIVIPDDVIDSGNTMLSAAQISKNMGAKRVFLIASHASFTEGVDKFDRAYQKGYFDTLYVTNGSYVPEEIKQKPWYREVDIAPMLADIIACLCLGGSTTEEMKKAERAVLEEVKRLKQS